MLCSKARIKIISTRVAVRSGAPTTWRDVDDVFLVELVLPSEIRDFDGEYYGNRYLQSTASPVGNLFTYLSLHALNELEAATIILSTHHFPFRISRTLLCSVFFGRSPWPLGRQLRLCLSPQRHCIRHAPASQTHPGTSGAGHLTIATEPSPLEGAQPDRRPPADRGGGECGFSGA
jgi:hypothetical protein